MGGKREVLHLRGGRTPLNTNSNITRHSTCSHALPVPNESKIRKEENESVQMNRNVKQRKQNNCNNSCQKPWQNSWIGNCLRSLPTLGEAYLCACCYPQCEHPSHWFLNSTIQSLRKTLVSQGFVLNKELQKKRKKKKEERLCIWKQSPEPNSFNVKSKLLVVILGLHLFGNSSIFSIYLTYHTLCFSLSL